MNSLVGFLVIFYLSSFTTCDTVAEGGIQMNFLNFPHRSLSYQTLREREDLRGPAVCSTTTTTTEEDLSVLDMELPQAGTELEVSAVGMEPPAEAESAVATGPRVEGV